MTDGIRVDIAVTAIAMEGLVVTGLSVLPTPIDMDTGVDQRITVHQA